MAEVVFDVISLIFQGVEGFVFDFPPGSADFYQFDHIFFSHVNVGHPAVVVLGLAVDDKLIVEKSIGSDLGWPLIGTALAHS